jgi:hypothetical protein
METKQTQQSPPSRDEMLGYIEKQQPEMAEKLRKLVDKEGFLRAGNVYGETYSDSQIGICYDGIFQAEYLRCRILETAREQALSVKQIAELLGEPSAKTLREVVELRRKNLMVLEKVDDRTPLYRAVG